MPSTDQLQAHQFSALTPGPKLIVTGAVHGNETCGTKGIQRVLSEFQSGQLSLTRGTLTLVPVCNPLAYANTRRAGDRNLNRRLQPTDDPRDHEDRVANVLCPWLAAHDALLDLHSFRSPGRPFVLRGPANNTGDLEPFAREAEESALAAHLGVSRVVEGWMSAYAGGVQRRRERLAAGGAAGAAAIEDPSYGIGTTEYMRSQGGYAVTLECGQHDDPQAPEVAYQAIRNTLAMLRLVDEPVPAMAAPFECLRLATVVDRLHDGDAFVKTWTSFDPLRAGELIAHRHDGAEVRAPEAGYIVFPDIGAKPGHEWFYFAQRSARAL